ncbi:MAG: AAA family ATPase [Planctomycetes bacterium]|nr:AAA family ATPase [Planctomycetota bacterium]
MSSLASLTIDGYRGFADEQTINFAVPNGGFGSGLTMIVGPNNAGKSSIIESLHAVSRQSQAVSISEGKRNHAAGDRVVFTIVNSEGGMKRLATVSGAGSETAWGDNQSTEPTQDRFFIVPSRRSFNPFFGKGIANRQAYMSSYNLPPQRGTPLQFSNRLFEIQKEPDAFNALLGRILDPVPTWYIDQNEAGQFYLKVKSGDQYHNSDGLGEGIISAMFIVDSLYDSAEGDIIVIDEPELSLHPALQRRLSPVLADYAKSRQIIYATHSPYFVNWKAIVAGAAVVRVRQKDNRSVVHHLSPAAKERVRGIISDRNNPHVLGLDASEAFFVDDKIVLVEGQEDVIFYARIMDQLRSHLPATFFGWGVGGASKMRTITSILHDLGYEKIVGILDGDKTQEAERLTQDFPEYKFCTIPAPDVRTKPARRATDEVRGLIDEEGIVRSEYRTGVQQIFEDLTGWLSN